MKKTAEEDEKTNEKADEKTILPRKTLTPRTGGSVVINPNLKKEPSNGSADQASGSAREN